jgi:putative membrane protein
MIRTTLTQALLMSCFLTGASAASAQGTMPESSPTASDIATKPGQSPDQTATQQLSDAQITTILMVANNAEVTQGKLAQKTAKNKEVVQFAKQMVNDHTASGKEVKDLNARMKVKEQSSAIRDQLDAAARSSDQRLKGKKGADFEKTYIDEQVTMHQTVLDTIDTQLMPNAKAEELKTLLTKTRSTIASHLDHAKQLQNSKAAM